MAPTFLGAVGVGNRKPRLDNDRGVSDTWVTARNIQSQALGGGGVHVVLQHYDPHHLATTIRLPGCVATTGNLFGVGRQLLLLLEKWAEGMNGRPHGCADTSITGPAETTAAKTPRQWVL